MACLNFAPHFEIEDSFVSLPEEMVSFMFKLKVWISLSEMTAEVAYIGLELPIIQEGTM